MRATANLLQLESYCNKQTKRYDEITVQVLSTVEATSQKWRSAAEARDDIC